MDLREKLSTLEVQGKPLTKLERVKLLLNEMTKNLPPMMVSMMPLVLPFDINSLTEENITEYLNTVNEVVSWIEKG